MHIHPVVPPHVDCALTPLGESPRPVVMALGACGRHHVLCHDGQNYVTPPALQAAA